MNNTAEAITLTLGTVKAINESCKAPIFEIDTNKKTFKPIDNESFKEWLEDL